ncbi:hypothetical protein K3495_g4400 [Podosphaera aphanis]|nr:hypothetical protein K3495_g4400 [Podosphaera aphanis]
MADAEGAFEKGTRRKKIAGYLKAANDIRQSYQQSYTRKWEHRTENSTNHPRSPSDSALSDFQISISGEEKLVLFPSYARRHSRRSLETNFDRNNQNFDTIDESIRGNSALESDQAIVDVDIRGWIYIPHKGPLNRKSRLLLALVRQLSGIPTPKDLNTEQYLGPRSMNMQETELLAAQSKTDKKTALAEHQFEGQITKSHTEIIHHDTGEYHEKKGLHTPRNLSCGVNKKPPWNQPSDMSQAELMTAHSNLMTRLSPFMANSLVSIPINVLFYNEKTSAMRTVKTNEYGHFILRAALEFVPTNVKVSVSGCLSVEEEVRITEPKGVSLISDIDDTIKHTSIDSGTREVFLNAFVRDLGDLTIDGVKEWYNAMHKTGVDIHYVSNSPWQFFPTLVNFFRSAGLPPGSYHLKHYSGMLQGIMEPVSERKKPTITKILSDFPDRSFILVGDSGEADLEVYSDIVLANPGRILMVLIRDLTQDFFDSASVPRGGRALLNAASSKVSVNSRTLNVSSDYAEIQSTRTLHTPSDVLSQKGIGQIIEKLIDFSDDEKDSDTFESQGPSRKNTESRALPPRPPKPIALRAPACTASVQQSSTSKKAPPLPPPPRSQTPNISLNNNRPCQSLENQSMNRHPNQINNLGSRAEPLASRGSVFENQLNPTCQPSQTSKADSVSEFKKPPGPQLAFQARSPAPSVKIDRMSLYSNSSSDDETYQPESLPTNKKLDLWRRRWKKAKQILESQGVVLRAWKVGSDASDETLRMIKEKMAEIDTPVKGDGRKK